MKPAINDADITTATATHMYGTLAFERTTQDRRTYYRLLLNGKGTGSLTSAAKARETIIYWGRRGWTNDVARCSFGECGQRRCNGCGLPLAKAVR